MTNYIQPGKNLDYVAAAVTLSGDVVKIGSIVGVASTDAAIGGSVAVTTEGVFNLPKEAPLVISMGDKVYWDATAKKVTKTTTSNTAMGFAAADAASADTTVNVKLQAF